MAAERLGNGLGDSLGLSLPFVALEVVNRTEFTVSDKEKEILRELAKHVSELAHRSLEEEKRNLWYKHNDLEPTRPLIFCDPENGWYQIIRSGQLKCQGDLARIWEYRLRKEIFWGEEMQDDRVIQPYFDVQHVFQESGRGLVERRISSGEDEGAYTWDPPLKDYKYFRNLRFLRFEIDYERSEDLLNLAKEVLGDLLNVRLQGVWWWSLVRTADFVSLRGLQQMMFDTYDNPEGVHSVMAFLRDEALAKLDFLEEKGLLSLNNDGTYVGSGGFGWTHQLPQDGFKGKVRTRDVWGFGESQETVGLSPEMFEEFIFAYQLPVLQRFGLNAYGCCEPLNGRWHIIRKIPGLRRISVSAWADIEDMAEKLGRDYLFSCKPTPSDLAVPKMDEDYMRTKLRNIVKTTRNCNVEIIMKDNHTIGNNPQNVTRWCRIAREEAESI